MAFNLVSAEQIKTVNLDNPDLPEDGGSGMTIKVDTAANLKKENPILLKGQLGAESDTTYMKLGDGVTAWNDLEYIKANKSVQDATGNVITDTYLKKTGDTATGDITAPNFVGHLKGNADTATKATQDADGNVIADTYAKKTELSGKQDKLTFDTTPTANSTNPVTSAGVKKYVDSALASLISADDKSY